MEIQKNNQEEPKKDGFDGILGFVKKNMRYLSAAALFVVLVLVLVRFTGTGKGTQEPQDEQIQTENSAQEPRELEAYQVDAYPAVNALVIQYYNAYASGDLGALSCLAIPISENEQSYVTLFSQYVESYQNIKCYTKPGLEDNSYLVSVMVDVKFTGVDTVAPGLDFFYVRTNAEGGLYIDNLYSQYNLANHENALDNDVQSLINTFENAEDFLALQKEVQERYDTALGADENLTTMISTTIPAAISEGMAVAAENNSESAEQPQGTETPQEGSEPSEQPADDGQTAPEQTPDDGQSAPEQTGETLYARERVNVRAGADTSTEKLGNVEMGEKVNRTGTEGEWSIIDFNGGKGYVKSEYLTADASEAEPPAEQSSSGGALSEGSVVTLKDSVNVRSSMGETAPKIGTAFAGEKVTVVMSYAEGWTKVNWNGQTGYIKTSLLQ